MQSTRVEGDRVCGFSGVMALDGSRAGRAWVLVARLDYDLDCRFDSLLRPIQKTNEIKIAEPTNKEIQGLRP